MKPSSRGRRQKQGLLTSLSQLKILKGLHWRWWMQLRRDSTPLIQSLKGKSCPNSLVVSWSMTLYATCLWFWRKLEGTKTHVTQAGSAEMISHATPMLPSLCVDVQHTRKSTLLVRVFTVSGKSSKRKKNDYSGEFRRVRWHMQYTQCQNKPPNITLFMYCNITWKLGSMPCPYRGNLCILWITSHTVLYNVRILCNNSSGLPIGFPWEDLWGKTMEWEKTMSSSLQKYSRL